MDLQPVHHSRSLFCLAKQSLTISLLTLRCTNSANIKEERVFDPKKLNFTLPNLATRIKDCKGIEIAHLISSLPHSGLRPDLLEYLQYYHPVIIIFLLCRFINNILLANGAFFEQVLEGGVHIRVS